MPGSKYKIDLKLKAKKDIESEVGKLNISAGSSFTIKFKDFSTKFHLNYNNPDSMTFGVDGSFEIVDIEKTKIWLEPGFKYDFIKDATTLSGKLKIRFGKNVNVEFQTILSEEGNKYIGGVTFKFN